MENSLKNHKSIPALLLISVAVIWGFAFVSMKTTLERLDVYSFLAWRFTFATLLLILIRPKVLKEFNLPFLKRGVLVGLFLGSGYIFQSLGLTKTTVGKTGFITGLYVVLTPIIGFIFLKKKVAKWDWYSAIIATIGLGLLSFKGFGMGFGEFLVLVSAALFAIHILALSTWASNFDVYALTVLQLGTCAVLTFSASLFTGFHSPPDRGVWAAIIFTAALATAFAFIVQTWTQSFMSATSVAVILTLESVFAVLLGLLFLSEKLTPRIAIGGALVLVAMYLIIYFDSKSKVAEHSYHD
jgi:drug/metabolite transporter (DMT)-like permease